MGSRQISTADQRKLDEYLTGIREIESRIANANDGLYFYGVAKAETFVQALYKAGEATVSIVPERSAAIRDERYKIVRNTTQTYDPGAEFPTPEGCYITELSNSADDPGTSIARASSKPTRRPARSARALWRSGSMPQPMPSSIARRNSFDAGT